MLSALGKADIRQELIRLLTLQGSGPQLYFLPFLLLVWLFWRSLLDLARLARLPSAVALSAGIIALLVLAVRFPTAAATGSERPLLLLYAAAYGLGRVSQPLFRADHGAALLLAAAAVPLAFGGQIDPRLADLAGMCLLAAGACELHKRDVLRGISVPGSGGVYLMHTPIMNHAISTLLFFVGIASGCNVFATVILTYGLCVTMTLTAIGRWPQLRPWLLE